MKIIYCQDHPDIEADYLWKDGKEYIPVCCGCAADWSIEEKIDSNEIKEVVDLEDEEREEFTEKYGK